MLKKLNCPEPVKLLISSLFTLVFTNALTPVLAVEPQASNSAVAKQSLSFTQAEALLQHNAYAVQAADAGVIAAQNQAQASAQLWRPIISLNANAIQYHTEVDIPLADIKSAGENAANQAFGQSLNDLPIPLPSNIASLLSDRFANRISSAFEQIPNASTVAINDRLFRPTLSAVLPLYTGGSIQAAQQIAQLGYEKAELSRTQVVDQQTLKLTEAYFGQQLAVYLKQQALNNLNGLQQHLSNTSKLEQQGMISRAQRLQVEVAMQATQRQYDQTVGNELSTRYFLQQLLQQATLPDLTTGLFIYTKPLPPLEHYIKQFQQDSPQLAQLSKDQQLATQAVQVAKASLLPTAYAFGQQTLNKNDWLVGVGANYTLVANIDRKKLLNAAHARVEMTQALQQQAQQDLIQVIVRAYHDAETARRAFLSMQTNIVAAQENLRVQQLSFREGETTASLVNDAMTALNLAYTDQAIAAYRFDLALSILLTTTGQSSQFQQYLNSPHSIYVHSEGK